MGPLVGHLTFLDHQGGPLDPPVGHVTFLDHPRLCWPQAGFGLVQAVISSARTNCGLGVTMPPDKSDAWFAKSESHTM